MNFLNLNFPDSNLEALFRGSLSQPKFEKYLEILILCAFIMVSFVQRTEIIIAVGFFCFATLLLNFPNLLKINFKFCFVVGLSLSLLHSLHTKFQAYSQEDFTSFACLELMLANQATYLEGKILTLFILLSLGFAIFGGEILTVEILLRSILLAYIFYCFEKRQRDLFKSQHETQEELRQLKGALQKVSSPYLCAFDYHTHKSLFQNKAFESLLESFEDQNPLLSFQKSFQINNSLNLKNFLEGIQACNFSDSETWFLSGSCKTQEKIIFFDITIVPILWNKTPSFLLALNDVTHKKELQELQLAQEDKDLLIATVAHELRTPLNGVLGLIQIVEPKIKEQETLDYLSLCKDNANLLLNLVNSLLDNQQIQHGKMKLFPSKVDIQSLVKNVLALFSFQAKQKNITLSAFIEDDVPPFIVTDENRLKQVLINLVSNALKFTFSGGITIKISQQDQTHLRFSISDTGRGIKKDDLSKIFQQYAKLEDKEGLNKQGVGLGLTISNNIAKLLSHQQQQQNGITVESQYGLGSTFSFLVHKSLNQALFFQKTQSLAFIKEYFPTQSSENIQDFEEFSKPIDLKSKLSLYTTTPHASSPNDSHLLRISNIQREKGVSLDYEISQRSNFTPVNITKLAKSELQFDNSKGLVLVVDDNYYNILIAKNLLENMGYQVQTAFSGQEAIEKFEGSIQKGHSFCCIFMDLQMPIMDGFETTKLLKMMMKMLKVESVPIVALTASYDQKTVQACYQSGMAEYLCKPLDKEDLLKVLCKIESQK